MVYFSQLSPNLSIIIFISRDHGCQFRKFFIPLDFPLNFRKSHRCQKFSSKALKVMDKNLWGVSEDPPGLNRVKIAKSVEIVIILGKIAILQ